MSSRRPPSLPPEIAGFSYIELLGSGGFADVFLYEQRMPRRRVAIKVLLPETLTDGARESFDAEANLMAQLSTHPSIVTIYQADISADGRPYLAMEYCSRPNLGARYRREKIGVAEVLRIGVQVAGAVETSHRAGILHRDIKPANILTTEYNRPALTDFGISVALVGGGDGQGGSGGPGGAGAEQETVGMSIPWSPPEVFGAVSASGSPADIYSLGATVYTLLAGRTPFEVPGGANAGIDLIARIQSAALQPTGRADVPESLEQILRVAMAKRPADRFTSALEFARALQKVQLELSLSVTPADVLDDALPAETAEEEDDGNTRIRGIVTIDPTAHNTSSGRQPSPSHAPPAPAQGWSAAPAGHAVPPVDATQLRSGAAASAATTAASGQGFGTGTSPGLSPAPRLPFGSPHDAASGAPAVEETVHRAPNPGHTPGHAPGHGATTAAPPRRRALPVIIGASAVVVVLAVLGIVFAVNAGNGSPAAQASTAPDAPVNIAPAETVSPATGLTSTAGAGGVVFTWANPAPKAGDVYLWGVVTPGAEPKLASTPDPTVTVPAPTSGQVCVEVSIRRTDGHASDPVTACAP
ncbi:serine/threonine-protein kinase [Subtercola sp. RTI3]|uniref:serine/threonine-protein kinase n=1 Tax=Subtercola sp. RTI3 TaxID=3048639 RepID=UPI002B229F81|nr:serine/threonine-protein kinase [Subtercola sp. RTI3]MEA9986102.1 serine/threonine-protein kinase [Subtercola sp. RTI3]